MPELPITCRHVVRTAAKAHECAECRGIIRPRERYNAFDGVWGSKRGWETFRTCTVCEELREELSAGTHPDDGIAFGDLAEVVSGPRTPAPIFNRFLENLESRNGETPWAQEKMVKEIIQKCDS
jgi:hypothetical protein